MKSCIARPVRLPRASLIILLPRHHPILQIFRYVEFLRSLFDRLDFIGGKHLTEILGWRGFDWADAPPNLVVTRLRLFGFVTRSSRSSDVSGMPYRSIALMIAAWRSGAVTVPRRFAGASLVK